MSSSEQPRKVKGKGRRKLSMEKIENQSNLQVTFSKRRVGLFKKANELCTLTGAEAGLVVFSPTNKPYSFGHPSFNTIVDRFIHQNSLHPNIPTDNHFSQGNTSNDIYSNVESRLHMAKKQGEELDREKMSPEVQEFFTSTEALNPQSIDEITYHVRQFENIIDRAYLESANKAVSVYYAPGYDATAKGADRRNNVDGMP